MKKFILLIIFITANHLCFSQVINIAYIKSFDKVENTQNINFQRAINSHGELMIKQEALDYVYRGDTSRLYCIHKIFNMEIEKVSYNVNGGYNGLSQRREQYTRLSTQIFNLSECKTKK